MTVSVCAALFRLPAAIPEILEYRFGPDGALAGGNYDVAVVSTFADREAYRVYATRPAHQRVLSDVVRPRRASRAAVQFSS